MYNIRKTNDPILRKSTDGRTGGRTVIEVNESDLMGRESDFIRITSSVQNLIKINEIRVCLIAEMPYLDSVECLLANNFACQFLLSFL